MQKQIRCALYDRVSTELQVREGLSLNAQRQALTEYAQMHDYLIVDYYTDEGITARKNMQNRKELTRLLEDVKADKIDLILVTKLDRWFRNIKDYHNTQAILEAHHCNWKTIYEQYDTTTANGRFAINIMLSVNENECDRDSDRIKEVFAYKRSRGEVLSGAHVSFGYRVINKSFQKDPEKSPIVEELFAYYFTCHSKRKTLRYIQEKYLSQAPSESTMMYMFKNPVYYGCAYGKENFCEAYITKEQFQSIQERGSLKLPPPFSEAYLFSGLIKCPYCGRNFSGFRHKVRKKSGKEYSYPVYHCKQHQRSPHLCPGGITLYESTVEHYLLDYIPTWKPGLADAWISFRLAANRQTITVSGIGISKDNLPGSFSQITTANKAEVFNLQKELSRLNLLFQKGRIEENYYEKNYEKIKNKLSLYQNALRDMPLPRDRSSAASFSFQGDWHSLYEQLDKEHRRAFWYEHIEKIHLDKSTHRIEKVTLVQNAVENTVENKIET